MPILRLLSLPVRAPLLTVLFFVAVLLGNHWQIVQHLLLRQVSLLMASNRVMTLVVTLLVVITGGIYLLKLNVLTDVLILASAVLLARLDLIRIGVLPAAGICLLLIGLVVFGGIVAGTLLPHPTASLFAEGLIAA